MAEVIRVTCKKKRCAYQGRINEYSKGYWQHSEWRCGECGGELIETETGLLVKQFMEKSSSDFAAAEFKASSF